MAAPPTNPHSKPTDAERLARAEHRAKIAEARQRAASANMAVRMQRDLEKIARERPMSRGARGVAGYGMAAGRAVGASSLYGSYDSAHRTRLRSESRGPRGTGGSGVAPAAHLDATTMDELVRGCQEAARNDPLVKALMQCATSMVVGTGFTLDVKVGVRRAEDSREGLSAEEDDPENGADAEWKAKAERLWWEYSSNLHADDVEGEYGGGVGAIDVRGEMTDVDICDAILSSTMTDGDGILRRVDECGGSTQWIDGTRIQSPRGRTSPAKIDKAGGEMCGVEVNAFLKPIRFHIADWSEDLTRLRSTGAGATTAINANEVFFVKNPLAGAKRFNTVRGEPALACILGRLEEISSFKEAVRACQRVAACMAAVRKSPNPGAMQNGFSGATVQIPGGGGDGTPTEVRYHDIEPGTIMDIGMDTEIQTITPTQPSTQYQAYVMGEMMECGAAIGVPIALALMDPRQTNYSSLRSILSLSHRNFRRLQLMLSRILTGLYRWKVRQWIERGLLSDRDDWDAHDWIAPPMVMLDPKSEIAALRQGMDSCVMTLKQAVAAYHGSDLNEHLHQLAIEKKEMDRLGITRSLVPGTAFPPPDEQTTEGEETDDGESNGDTGSAAEPTPTKGKR